MHIRTLAAAGLASLAMASTASAAILNAPVPTNAYITVGGLDWAWGNPVAGSIDDLTYQGAFGWRLPTAEEMANAPLASAFLFVGGNVPYNGTDPVSGAQFQATNGDYTGAGACAAPYFSSTYSHCDWSDGDFKFWAGTPNSGLADDQLYVRTTGFVSTAPVPEPSTWAMLIAGFGALGVMMRRRRPVTA